jgi:hypothetical protein
MRYLYTSADEELCNRRLEKALSSAEYSASSKASTAIRSEAPPFAEDMSSEDSALPKSNRLALHYSISSPESCSFSSVSPHPYGLVFASTANLLSVWTPIDGIHFVLMTWQVWKWR